MKINLTNISKGDLGADSPSWVNPLIDFMNRFMTKVRDILNGNITFDDNVRAIFDTTSFMTDAAYTGGTFIPLSFSVTFQPKCVFLISAIDTDEPTTTFLSAVTIPPNWSYDNANNQITVYYITGLQNSTNYSIKVLII